MNAELTEHSQFVHSLPPFDTLSSDQLELVMSGMRISYFAKGNSLVDDRIYVVKKGNVKKNDEHFAEGESFGVAAEQGEAFTVTEDALLYYWPIPQLTSLLKDNSSIIAFWFEHPGEQLHSLMSESEIQRTATSFLYTMRVEDCAEFPIATLPHDHTIQQIAQKMTELGHSSLLLTNEAGLPSGIVTDRDIRSRCVAQGLPFDQVGKDIMTKNMTTIDAKASCFEALMIMIEKGIHHLPVVRSEQRWGMLTLTDLMLREGHNPLHLSGRIKKAQSLDALIATAQLLPNLQFNLTKLGMSAVVIARSISAIVRAISVRLLQFAEQEFGPAPCDYAWLCAGSLARNEQFVGADQDNALIYDDSQLTDAASAQDYFYQLSQYVCDGLNACGFVYCPGDVMASNPKWCQPVGVWHDYFSNWIEQPKPKALMHCDIFFDLDTIYGNTKLLNTLKTEFLHKTQRSTLFLAHLSRNAVSQRPPLGFFRDFILISSGENKSKLDLKHNAIAQIVALARIYALSLGSDAVSTLDRLHACTGTKVLSKSAGKSLIAAFEFVFQLRLEHQLQQVNAGLAPSNFIAPKDISRLERKHLKDVFKVIKQLQDARQVVY